jgi:predicted NBD/HSP70 family sugar kinase
MSGSLVDAHTVRRHPALLRRVNQAALLELIRVEGPITRLELARRLHLSLPTITRIVHNLVQDGIILEKTGADSSGGRRPSFLEYNFRSSLVVSVYVGEKMSGALADLNGAVLKRRTVNSSPGEAGFQCLLALLRDFQEDAFHYGAPLRGVCVGIPSIIQYPAGVVTWAPYLEWRDLPLQARLQEALGLLVIVENEVNLIALGEQERGAAQGSNNLICISLGAGIGAGLIINGQLLRGYHSAAGEIGYIIPNEDCLSANTGGYGCLEALAGSTGIAQRARQYLQAGVPSNLFGKGGEFPDDLSAQTVLQAARSGDLLSIRVVDETVDWLSIALVNVICVVDPECIILSGELSEFSDLFIPPLQQRLGSLLPAAMPRLLVSELNMGAAVVGAVKLVLRHTSDAVVIQSFVA